MVIVVLGSGCYVHGIDINKACTKFANGRTTITIGDQADPAMWHKLFEVFPKLQPGGVIAIEDIHGQHYIQTFFTPSAHYLAHMASQGAVESVHVYPFLLVVHKTGQAPGRPKA